MRTNFHKKMKCAGWLEIFFVQSFLENEVDMCFIL